MDAARNRPRLIAAAERSPAPRQRRSLEKRGRLKEAALRLFGERGYENTSVEEIARRAHLAVGGFYQHFKSKRHLLIALMDELVEHLSRLELRPAAAGDPRAVIHALIAAAFDRDLRYLGAYRAWEEAVLSDPDLARRHRALHGWTTGRVMAVFTALQRLPGARTDVDVARLARAMDTFFWSLLAQAVRMSKKELSEAIGAVTDLIYHALFVDGASTGPLSGVQGREATRPSGRSRTSRRNSPASRKQA
jgi:AcrR family transcriptional regulator